MLKTIVMQCLVVIMIRCQDYVHEVVEGEGEMIWILARVMKRRGIDEAVDISILE